MRKLLISRAATRLLAVESPIPSRSANPATESAASSLALVEDIMNLTVMTWTGNVKINYVTWQYRRGIITTPLEQSWGESVREMIRLANISEAELARKCNMAAPVLFRYLRAKRRPSAPMVRRINNILGKLFGQPNITDYLSAVASRDDLVSADGRSLEDFTDVLSFVSKDMRDGYDLEFRRAFANQPELNRTSLRSDLIAEFRRRLIRHVTGEVSSEPKLEAFVRIISSFGLPARDWIKPEITKENESDAWIFYNAVIKSLASTSLCLSERLDCEFAITSAFRAYMLRFFRDNERFATARAESTERIIKSSYDLGYITARAEIFNQLAKGETPK